MNRLKFQIFETKGMEILRDLADDSAAPLLRIRLGKNDAPRAKKALDKW
jgi:hypothetical protein